VEEVASGAIRSSVKVRKDSGELRLPQALGDESLDDRQIGWSWVTARLLD